MRSRCLWMGITVLLAGVITGWAGVQEGIRAMREGDFKKAHTEFLPLANAGDDKAMVTLGTFYYEGKGVSQDYSKALEWFLKALEKDNADAFSNIGVMFRDGLAVPKNKKIAYCIFLITHVCGLGSEDTQLRVNSCLREMIPEMTKEELVECFNYTPAYINAYIQSKGTLKDVPEKYRPSSERPAIKDMPWWLDGELDFLPEDQRPKPRPPPEFFTLRYQIKGKPEMLRDTTVYTITDGGIGKGPLGGKQATQGVDVVCEDTMSISDDSWRYIAVEPDGGALQVFTIDHSEKPKPCDWSTWRRPEFIEPDTMAVFGLCGGQRSKQAHTSIPPNTPWLRFKVEGQENAHR